MADEHCDIYPFRNWRVGPTQLNPPHIEHLPGLDRSHGLVPDILTATKQNSAVVSHIAGGNRSVRRNSNRRVGETRLGLTREKGADFGLRWFCFQEHLQMILPSSQL